MTSEPGQPTAALLPRWRFAGELSMSVPTGWRATEALAITSGDGRLHIQAERTPIGPEVANWAERRLEALGRSLSDVRRRAFDDQVEIGGEQRPVVAFDIASESTAVDRVAGLSVLLGVNGAELVVTAFGPAGDGALDELLAEIGQAGIASLAGALSFTVGLADVEAGPVDGDRTGHRPIASTTVDWSPLRRRAWDQPVVAAPDPVEAVFVGSHEELAVVTAMLGLGPPAGVDLRWLAGLGVQEREAICTAASRSLLVRGSLVRDVNGTIVVATRLGEVLGAGAVADLIIEVTETVVGPGSFDRRSTILCGPAAGVEISPVSLEAVVVQPVDPSALVARFVAGGADDQYQEQGQWQGQGPLTPMMADLEALVGEGRAGDTGLPTPPPGSSLIGISALHRTSEGLAGGQLQVLRMPGLADWQLEPQGDRAVLAPLRQHELQARLLDILPGAPSSP